MKQCQHCVEKCLELLESKRLSYDNTILIGDNAVGKSEVIKRLIKHKMASGDAVYFIDAVNRSFHISQINNMMKEISFSKMITEVRVRSENFNLVDTWACYGTQTECIEMVYEIYEKELQELFYELFGDTFCPWIKEAQEVKYQNGEVGKLSNGYQAVIRILLELLYVKETGTDNVQVIIDEADEYLSPKNARKLYPFLIKHFPKMKFICSTHSPDFIVDAQDTNLLILKREETEVLDTNDFCDIDDVMNVFKEVFDGGQIRSGSKKQEDRLRMLLNNRIAGVWGEEEDIMLSSIKENKLSNAQKLIYRQIKEW